MNLTQPIVERLRDALTWQGDMAPAPVICAVHDLTDGEELIISLTLKDEQERATGWQASLVTRSGLFVHASASAEIADWDLKSHSQSHAKMATWVRPLSELRAIETGATSDFGTEPVGRTEWHSAFRLVFAGGATVDLPGTGEVPSWGNSDLIRGFVRQLRSVWMGGSEAYVSD